MGLTNKEKEEIIPNIIDTRIKATIESAIVSVFQQGDVLAAIIPSIVTAVRDAVSSSVKEELAECHKELGRQGEELSNLTEKFTSLQRAHDALQAKVNDLEQYSRRNCVTITGIPEPPGEKSTDDAVLTVVNNTLGCDPPISLQDIDRCHRLGKPRSDGKPRPVIVKLCSYRCKASLMRAKSKPTSKANLSKDNIYINDNLTTGNLQLFKEARLLVKDKRLSQAWTYDGKIFVRSLNGERKMLRVSSDLDPFKSSE
ncbi:PREDICTED: uncharacterized protein LOC109481645 [Branchiostoma belcheri]|uniref:Uncharacterized protein LOC109481645 n=1 Tax=Branchiostoma belcheri TaxID=7741 RepID=A0A6P5A8Y0_BRABE|nr:PREDICTED: uncharacterized protein LOC109481645 [Branchiostoma belcheri]